MEPGEQADAEESASVTLFRCPEAPDAIAGGGTAPFKNSIWLKQGQANAKTKPHARRADAQPYRVWNLRKLDHPLLAQGMLPYWDGPGAVDLDRDRTLE
jgi:hypothetical protein